MRRLLGGALCLLLLLSACAPSNQTQEHALERAEDYAHAINYDYETPEKIYDFLCAAYKEEISEEDFCEAFLKERSYPYLTPLYINYPEVTLSEDGLTAEAVFDRAARLPGMSYEFTLVYENGDYYVEDWEQLIDGSYLDKFEDIPYSLDSYFDFTDTD